jgi:hypothetical protein
MTIETNKAIETGEMELGQVLSNFRQSVHAWSDAEYNRPRTVAPSALRRTWRMTVAWALGCVLAAGSLSGGLFELRHKQEMARAAAERDTHLRQAAAAQPAVAQALVKQADEPQAGVTDEELLAAVDKDVSRVAPSAMEPLAQLMDDNGGR